MTIPMTTPGSLSRGRTPISAILRRIAVTGALALSVLALAVPAASAGEYQSIRTREGVVEFRPDGEVLVAVELKPGGYDVRARLSWCVADDDCTDATVTDGGGYPDEKNLSIRENLPVLLDMCYVKDGHVVKCSNAQSAVA